MLAIQYKDSSFPSSRFLSLYSPWILSPNKSKWPFLGCKFQDSSLRVAVGLRREVSHPEGQETNRNPKSEALGSCPLSSLWLLTFFFSLSGSQGKTNQQNACSANTFTFEDYVNDNKTLAVCADSLAYYIQKGKYGLSWLSLLSSV